MIGFDVLSRNGMKYNDTIISNAVPKISGVYLVPGEEEPSVLEVTVWIGALQPKVFVVTPEKLCFHHLHKLYPQIRCGSSRKKELFDEYLNGCYIDVLEKIQKGDL